MKWYFIAGGALLGLPLLTAAAAGATFHFALGRPPREAEDSPRYRRSRHYQGARAGMALMDVLPKESIWIESRDGLRLHGTLYPGEKGGKRVLLGIHGYHSYARREFGPFIAFWHGLGFHVLLPDVRAHAPSEGRYIGFGVLDRLDVLDWSNYIVSRFGAETELYLHGVSMGSAAVMAAAGEPELPGAVRGIVADCGYTRAWEVLAYQLRLHAHLPPWPMLTLCEGFCRRRAGYDFHSHTPLEGVRRAKVPIFFVQGTADRMVPPEMARELWEACASRKELLMVEGAGHAASMVRAPETYAAGVREFFGLEPPLPEEAGEES